MLLSPVKNCNGFFKSRPPTVVFLTCLLLMMIATFSLSYYIKHTDKIINSDAKQTWVTLREQLSKLVLCPDTNNSHTYSKRNSKYFIETVTVAVPIKVNLKQLKNVSDVQIVYNLTALHWYSSCPDDQSKQLPVIVNFTVPQNPKNDQICAIVQGPKSYLPKYSEPACVQNISNKSGVTSKIMHLKNGICSDHARVKLLFDNDKSDENFAIFLSQSDKNIIYVHLMWCAYILLFFILVVLLYAVFYQNEDQRLV